jgi:hypothetical protein
MKLILCIHSHPGRACACPAYSDPVERLTNSNWVGGLRPCNQNEPFGCGGRGMPAHRMATFQNFGK